MPGRGRRISDALRGVGKGKCRQTSVSIRAHHRDIGDVLIVERYVEDRIVQSLALNISPSHVGPVTPVAG
jgi:hypothetical protein